MALIRTSQISGSIGGTAFPFSGSAVITGSLLISGSETITGSLNVTQGITGSLFGTSSWSANAITASYIITAQTASYVLNAVSASYALSSSQAQTASYVLNAVSASYALNGGVTQLLAGPNVTLSPTNGLGQVTISSTSGGGGFNTATGSYGSFYSTQTQTNVAGTARSMSLNITDITNGVSISGSTNPFNTYIKTQNAGVYDIQFSAQVDKTDSGTDEIWIWLRKNGTDISDSATSVQLVGNGAHYVAAWNFFVNSAANDYYQLMWYSPDPNVRLHAEPAFGVVPGIPSLIVTANRVDQFLSNTGSFSGSFTGSLLGTASFAQTASYVKNAVSASYVLNAISSSYAATTSYVNPLNQNVQITGSLTNGASSIVATGNYSHAEGEGTTANGQYSHAEGFYTTANGIGSHTEGNTTTATGTTGNYSHAEGYYTIANGYASHAEGSNTISNGSFSHAEGSATITGTQTAHQASITAGIVFINGDVTSLFTAGNYLYLYDVEFGNVYQYASFLISGVDFNGTQTRIFLADGSVNAATAYVGDLSVYKLNQSFGGDKTIPGNYSHTEGNTTTALGSYSHAEGEGTQAVGIGSHAEGFNTIAVGNYQHVQGTFNLPSTISSAFILGNGIDSGNKSNLIFAAGTEVQITGSLNVTQGITGDLTGTATNATNATNADTAATASFVNILNQNVEITGSLNISGSLNVSSSLTTLANGNVGIGITNPQVKLHISGAASEVVRINGNATTQIVVQAGSLTGGPGRIELQSGTNNNSYMRLGSSYLRESSGFLTIANAIVVPTATLQIRGSGATSATRALLVQNSTPVDILTIFDNKSVNISGSVTVTGSLLISPSSSFTLPTTQSAAPAAGTAYFSNNFLYVYNGSAWRSASLS